MLRLRQVRKAQKLSLKDLAAKTGLSLQILSKYELGMVDPPSSKLLAIALALGVPIGTLYPPDGDETAPAPPTNGQAHPHG